MILICLLFATIFIVIILVQPAANGAEATCCLVRGTLCHERTGHIPSSSRGPFWNFSVSIVLYTPFFVATGCSVTCKVALDHCQVHEMLSPYQKVITCDGLSHYADMSGVNTVVATRVLFVSWPGLREVRQ